MRKTVWIAAMLLLAARSAGATGSQSTEQTGDVLRLAIPAATFGIEWLRGEHEGAWQYGEELGVSLVATEVLKYAVHEQRPDKSDHLSFPSGHATAAFSAASYVHRRYGFVEAAPLYVLGAYVGYTRVQANRHRWSDVAGSLAVTTASSWWLVTPRSNARVAIVPEIGRHRAALTLAISY